MTIRRIGAGILCCAAVVAAGCGGKPLLLEGVRARGLAESLHLNFTKAVEAADRAVMADTDDASEMAAREARTATEVAQKSAGELKSVLQELGYADESAQLGQFETRFEELRKIDSEILPLAIENSNLKAQRLSFEEAQRSVDTLTSSLETAAAHAPKGNDAPLTATRALNAVLRIQTLQARHIAESSDENMDAIEKQMREQEATAREQLARLASIAGGPAQPDIDAARVALDIFMDDNRSIVRLSRRNSNVRSLALSLGRKRMVVAECEAHLAALDAALVARESTSVR